MGRRAKSDAVRIKELEVLQSFLTNSVVSFVLGFATLEYLQKQKITGSVETTTAEIALGTIAVAQAVGPYAPGVIKAAGDAQKGLVESGLKALPIIGGLVP